MTIQEQFESLVERVNHKPEGIAGVNANFQFNISGEESGTYQVKLENGKAYLLIGEVEKPSCTFVLSAENLIKLVKGELNATMAYMSGKLKINGDLASAMKLYSILKFYQS